MKELTPEEMQELRVVLKQAFDEVDTDKSGYLDAKEFEQSFIVYNGLPECKKKLTPAEMKKLSEDYVRIADEDGDGKINFYEYVLFMLRAHEARQQLKEEDPRAKPVPQSSAKPVSQSSDNGACCQQ